MVLLELFTGIVLITLIAKYNESNRLFWQLLLAFIGGYTAAQVVEQITSEKKVKTELTQVYPTQAPTMTPGTIMYPLGGDSLEVTKEETSEPASQANTPATSECCTTLRKVVLEDDQYLHILPNPPNEVTPFDTS